MLSILDDGIPVHGAIYSKEELGDGVLEEAILDKTGFEVEIEG